MKNIAMMTMMEKMCMFVRIRFDMLSVRG